MSPTPPPLHNTQFHHAHSIDQRSQTALLKPNPRLDSCIANSKANSLPDITISALQGQYLAIQCRLIGAKSILEVGTLGGYSTIWFAPTGAHVTSIELNPKHRDVAVQNLAGLDNVDIILGAALDVLPNLFSEGRKFDFVFIDAAWGEQWEYFDWAVRLTRPGGCVYVDNVVRQVLEADEENGDGMGLVRNVGRDGRVEATLVSTVGSHKKPEEMFDGFLLAVVKG